MRKKETKIEMAETLSGHWYKVGKAVYPSVTTILTAYPQNLQLTQWIANQGWETSQAIKREAGERGTNVHTGIEALIQGKEISRTAFSQEEWLRLDAFVKWVKEINPTILATEVMVYSKKHKFAGKVDCIMKVKGDLIVTDWKTSKSIYPHFALQVAAYATAIEELKTHEVQHTGILQLGARNKNGYRWLVQPDWKENFKVFLGVKKVFDHEWGDAEPPILQLPDKLKL